MISGSYKLLFFENSIYFLHVRNEIEFQYLSILFPSIVCDIDSTVDWLQSLKQFFINVSYHILVASLTLMALTCS